MSASYILTGNICYINNVHRISLQTKHDCVNMCVFRSTNALLTPMSYLRPFPCVIVRYVLYWFGFFFFIWAINYFNHIWYRSGLESQHAFIALFHCICVTEALAASYRSSYWNIQKRITTQLSWEWDMDTNYALLAARLATMGARTLIAKASTAVGQLNEEGNSMLCDPSLWELLQISNNKIQWMLVCPVLTPSYSLNGRENIVGE